MKRIKFTVAGIHPLLYLTRNTFIQNGLELVPWETKSYDFALIGAEAYKSIPLAQLDRQLLQVEDKPALLLSSSSVYSDLRRNKDQDGRLPMKEGDLCAIVNTAFKESFRPAYALMAENLFRARIGQTLVLRPFNIFGPDIEYGVVRAFAVALKSDQDLHVYGSGQQFRGFITQKTFENAMLGFLEQFLGGVSGVYNVGSSEPVQIQALAWRMAALTLSAQKSVGIKYEPTNNKHTFYKVCDNTKSLELGIKLPPANTIDFKELIDLV